MLKTVSLELFLSLFILYLSISLKEFKSPLSSVVGQRGRRIRTSDNSWNTFKKSFVNLRRMSSQKNCRRTSYFFLVNLQLISYSEYWGIALLWLISYGLWRCWRHRGSACSFAMWTRWLMPRLNLAGWLAERCIVVWGDCRMEIFRNSS